MRGENNEHDEGRVRMGESMRKGGRVRMGESNEHEKERVRYNS